MYLKHVVFLFMHLIERQGAIGHAATKEGFAKNSYAI